MLPKPEQAIPMGHSRSRAQGAIRIPPAPNHPGSGSNPLQEHMELPGTLALLGTGFSLCLDLDFYIRGQKTVSVKDQISGILKFVDLMVSVATACFCHCDKEDRRYTKGCFPIKL